MNQPLPPDASQPIFGELQELVLRPILLPDETPATYDGLREALIRDLAPVTPYECMLAENLVQLEWERIRHRLLRDSLVKAKARDLVIGLFATGKLREVDDCKDEHRDLALALFNENSEKSAEACRALTEHKVTAPEIHAKAYAAVAHQVDPHEKALAALETRRRRLREDYDRLKATRRKPVEDAEIVE